MLSIQEQNRLANVYKKEADKHNIGSPYRIKVYVDARIKGLSEEKALAKTKLIHRPY